jgi:hypothetical protein
MPPKVSAAVVRPKTLVFSGGGTRCLLFLPALLELQKKGLLTDVEECWGTSAGVLVAALYLLSKDAQKVYDIMFSTDFSKLRDIDITNLLTINQSWGMDDGKNLVQMMEQMLEQLGASKLITLRDIPGIHAVVSDLTQNKIVVLSAKTFPEVRLTDAIRASMSLPFFFRPYIHESGNIWVDGALRYNFPWPLVPNTKTALGFAFKKPEYETPKSIAQYIHSIITFCEPAKKVYENPENIIFFKRPEYPSWFIKFTEEDYTMVKEQSVKTIDEWFLSTGSAPPLKRSESPLQSADHCTPLQASPQRHTTGLSDTLTPSHEQVLGASLPQLPCTQPSYRRWSV